MGIANVSFRIDSDLKRDAEKLFKEMGLNMTTAFNIFLRQSVRERRIPFNVTTQNYNEETLKALDEGEKLSNNPNVKGYELTEALKELKK